MATKGYPDRCTILVSKVASKKLSIVAHLKGVNRTKLIDDIAETLHKQVIEDVKQGKI